MPIKVVCEINHIRTLAHMLTIEDLVKHRILMPLSGSRLSFGKQQDVITSFPRTFLYSNQWGKEVMLLPAGKRAANSLERDLSERGRVLGSAYDFAEGVPYGRLARPVGSAMKEPFKRMEARSPYTDSMVRVQRVVYLRTNKTRSFGFFAKKDLFVAVCLKKTTELKTVPKSVGLEIYAQSAEIVMKFINKLAGDQVDETEELSELVTC